jgi:hypothetical protein
MDTTPTKILGLIVMTLPQFGRCPQDQRGPFQLVQPFRHQQPLRLIAGNDNASRTGSSRNFFGQRSVLTQSAIAKAMNKLAVFTKYHNLRNPWRSADPELPGQLRILVAVDKPQI